jgi:hypothetical protein
MSFNPFAKKTQLHTGALQVPPLAEGDEKAQELVRAWVSQGNLHVSLRPDAFDDPIAWGVLLADLARHVSLAIEQTQGTDQAKTLARIRSMMEAEFEGPTEMPKGSISN